MRPLVILLLLAIPTNAAELCVVGGESICCHFLCDVYGPISEGGYSTSGLPTCGGNGQFTISSSDTDPYQNQGPLTGFPQLYLWVNADAGYGFRDGWGHLSGDLQVAIFSPLHPAVSWNPISQRFDVAVCTYEPVLLAGLVVWEPPVSVGDDVESESWGRLKARWHR